MKNRVNTKQSIKPVLGVIAAGLVLGATILLWNRDGAGKHAPQEKAEHSEHADGAEHGKDDAAQVAMTADQIRAAGRLEEPDDPFLPQRNQMFFALYTIAAAVYRWLILFGILWFLYQLFEPYGLKVISQVLAVISSPELAELRSTQLAAQKRLALAQLTYEREKKLWQDKISAEQDYLQARQAFHEAQIQAQNANAKLDALGAGGTGGAGNGNQGALNRYVLRAPFDGVVVEKHIALGEAVKEDANVFLLSDLSTVWVEVNVAARDIEAVRTGEPVTIQSTSTRSTAAGKISYVGSLLGEQTRTAKARVVIANPQMAWRPGLFVNVAMAQGVRQAPVAVHSDAVQTVDGKPVVFSQTAQGFQAHPVRTGVTDGAMVEILEGLPAGATYAAAGSFVVKAQQAKGSAGHDH